MEDIIEEIVGDIDDEYDEEEPDVEKISEDTFYLDGSMDLDDVNEETGSELFSEDSETVGGLIMEALGEIPEDGSGPYVITLDNYEFTVESIRDRRIERVRMKILPKTESEESGDEQ
ncbi:MAG: hemolysin, partial [Firmicutes bacterium]|nr:hemolysin [Bacillota bacterium]